MRRTAAIAALGAMLLLGPGSVSGGCGRSEREPSIEGGRRPEASVAAQSQVQRRAARGLRGLEPDTIEADEQILFGDLHVHTSYSWDGLLFTLPIVGGEGAHPPHDACDFARHCANLDFYALTDHAESLLPETWEMSKESVRQCNALAGDSANPDLVAFMGFEWSQAGLTPDTHWGHRCVVFPGTADEELPARPIGSGAKREMIASLGGNMSLLRWVQPQAWSEYSAFAEFANRISERAVCREDVPTRALPPDCEEIAPTPRELHEKLDQWGFDALTIPHGTAWGTYTPATTAIDKHLDPAFYDAERQVLIEVMSGHGNSESYRRWREFEIDEDGNRTCPAPTSDYLPCCWQAGEIMRSRCGDLPEAECQERVGRARRYATEAWTRPQQVFPDAALEDWADCGQCRDCFKPAFLQRPRESIQYAMSLSNFDANEGSERSEGNAGPTRFRYGFVASSDGHTARPGTGYKQLERGMMTDVVGQPGLLFDLISKVGAPSMEDPQQPMRPTQSRIGITGNDLRVQSFLYPGGLAAVHAKGRSRAAIWDAMKRREVYGTSGPRILLWFDLVNGDERRPMGSEVELDEPPRFEVRAVGSFHQKPGCPAWSRDGLSPERLQRLCRNECYHPSDQRRRIEAIEVVRIRPQQLRGESVDPLIEDVWKRFECVRDPGGCVVRFEDAEFVAEGRDALYYVRALEEESMALNGDPLGTRFDSEGNVVAIRPCTAVDHPDGCPAPVRERAWSSPIFVNVAR